MLAVRLPNVLPKTMSILSPLAYSTGLFVPWECTRRFLERQLFSDRLKGFVNSSPRTTLCQSCACVCRLSAGFDSSTVRGVGGGSHLAAPTERRSFFPSLDQHFVKAAADVPPQPARSVKETNVPSKTIPTRIVSSSRIN